MRKVLLVGWREFRQRVRSRGFIIGSIAVPIVLIVVWALTGTFGGGEEASPMQDLQQPAQQDTSLGYVDQVGLIQFVPDLVPPGMFRAFSTEDEAAAALEEGRIGAFYIVPEDYRQTGEIRRVSLELPAVPPDTQLFNWILVANLFPEYSTGQLSRLNWPFDTTGLQFVNLETAEEGGPEGGFSMLPFLVTIAVMLPLFTSGGYLLQSVTQEKSSRIMEILLVSLRPWHILAGKLLGLGGLTLVQYLIWWSIAGFGLIITGQNLPALLAGISLSLGEVMLVIPYALGGFLLYAGIMAGIGALSADIEGSRTWVFVISLPMLIPLYLWTAIVTAPNGVLAVALSLIPFSAPVAMLMRMVSAVVPTWQFALSIGLLVLTAFGMVLLMARLFRVKTLLSGESPSLSRFFEAVRGG